MEGRIDSIVMGPGPGDVSLMDNLIASGAVSIVGVVGDIDGVTRAWCYEKNIPTYREPRDIPRLLPGQMLLILRDDMWSDEFLRETPFLSIVGREVVRLIAAPRSGPVYNADKMPFAVNAYLRLSRDFFPGSRKSSTTVKLTACLTEASTAWGASGAAILTGAAGGKTLSLACYTGAQIPEKTVPIDGASLAARCFKRDKAEVAPVVSDGNRELVPGVTASSILCVPLGSEGTARGVLLLWSDKNGFFETADLTPMSLFGHYVATLMEIDDLSSRLEEALVIDPLTGLHNHVQFDHRLSLEIRRAERYSLNVALVVFDVDNLGAYNESCGRMLGNLALSDIASIFKKEARTVDFLARVGGDEFAIILPETGRLGAMRLAERLRAEVYSYPFPLPENSASAGITVSAGVASFPNSSENEHELLARAYGALEKAKKEGFNQVRLWEKERAGD